MVLGHIHFNIEYFDKIVYAFHMPLFFIISGMLYKQPDSLKDYIKRRTKSLLLPYFVFGMFYLIIDVLREGTTVALKDIISLLLYPTYELPIESALWFLPALYISLIIYCVIDRIIRNGFIKCATIVLLTFLGCYWNKIGIPISPWAFSSAISSLLFVHLGVKYRECRYVQKGITGKTNFYFTTIFMMLVFISILAAFSNPQLNMRLGDWGIAPVTYFNATILSFAIIEVAHIIYKQWKPNAFPYLRFVGKYSIAFLCVNHLPIMIVRKLFEEPYDDRDERDLSLPSLRSVADELPICLTPESCPCALPTMIPRSTTSSLMSKRIRHW